MKNIFEIYNFEIKKKNNEKKKKIKMLVNHVSHCFLYNLMNLPFIN